ncbi:predicted protein [Naegleria gruberi]|uniref:Predicted protein n=1 Tax=Naegleria gruberi TaxID=5762 RepID=D2VZ70_NAEGR|nr:uncharacterized protein NAEGRDRAFT_74380 [Naegleria gruberi]EFC37890.1 predicted protein [Naegleria gruberi]|eukprot:XP_002670634.1 predicted protein [Naegleria gruberi strain NEG-M]
MERSIMMVHATLFWLIFLLLSVSNSFLRESVYEPLAGELWSHIFATSSLVLINLLLMYYFFMQKRSYKKQALIKEKRERASSAANSNSEGTSSLTGGLSNLTLSNISNTTRKLFSFERKRNMFLIGVWWLLLTILFELFIGWIRGVDGLSESKDYSWLSYVSVMRWAKSHVVILIVGVQLMFPILIGTLVMRMDEKAEIVDRDLNELQHAEQEKKTM